MGPKKEKRFLDQQKNGKIKRKYRFLTFSFDVSFLLLVRIGKSEKLWCKSIGVQLFLIMMRPINHYLSPH